MLLMKDKDIEVIDQLLDDCVSESKNA